LEPVPDDDNKDKTEQKDAPDKVVDAAKGEVVEEAKTVEWEGLTFGIPREIPAVFLMDQVSMESSSDMTGMIRLLHTILGEEQFTQSRNRVVEISDANSMDDQVQHIVDLLNTVLNSYGTDQGESSASEDSSESAGS
jgi:hypothetical protein